MAFPIAAVVQGETTAVRLRRRTRLYVAAVRVNTQPTSGEKASAHQPSSSERVNYNRLKAVAWNKAT